MKVLEIPYALFQHLDLFWTFALLTARFIGLFFTMPGIGQGMTGVRIRMPAILLLSVASLAVSPRATLPVDIIHMAVALLLEALLGTLLGLIPLLIVVGVQTGGQLATGTMGLGGATLFDPSTGGSVSDIARIQGDLTVVVFLLFGGHYFLIEAASGLSTSIVPGSLSINAATVALLIDRTADVFRLAVMVSAPVIVALLFTQFVMGLISKAVPAVNIFIVSFPLTIGIGMILTILALPEIIHLLEREYRAAEMAIGTTVDSMKSE